MINIAEEGSWGGVKRDWYLCALMPILLCVHVEDDLILI